jgi:hypothetical protein
MSFDSQRTSSTEGRDMTIEIIRDPGYGGDWYNRYCQNTETHVHTFQLENLTNWNRKSFTTAMSLMTRTLNSIVATNMALSSQSLIEATQTQV